MKDRNVKFLDPITQTLTVGKILDSFLKADVSKRDVYVVTYYFILDETLKLRQVPASNIKELI